jgi:hypothetical protein
MTASSLPFREVYHRPLSTKRPLLDRCIENGCDDGSPISNSIFNRLSGTAAGIRMNPMSTETSDGREKRIANDIQLVFMGRAIERFFGKDALDVLIAHRDEKARKNWKKRSQESGRSDPEFLFSLFSEDAHEFEVIEKSEKRLEVKVTRCVHADLFRSYNAADLGEKLICSGDFAVVDGYNPKIRLTRPTTCMAGESCHFTFEIEV